MRTNGDTVTLHHTDSREVATVAHTVDFDPVSALMGADRDGLLTYHGFASGGLYEVDLVGQRRMLPTGEVVDTVERLRALQRVRETGVEVALVELRDDGVHFVNVGDVWVELPAGRVVDWCAGFVAAHAGEGQDHAGEDQLDQIAGVLERPGRDDQCRMVILGLMHGGPEEKRMSALDLSVRISKAKKTVVDALAFGNSMASDLAEKMIEAFGLRWSVTAHGYTRIDGDGPVEPLPQMPGMVALRRILAASLAGWLQYVDEPAVNKARWKTERDRWYRLTVGQQAYTIGTDSLDAWLDGLEAFHSAGTGSSGS